MKNLSHQVSFDPCSHCNFSRLIRKDSVLHLTMATATTGKHARDGSSQQSSNSKKRKENANDGDKEEGGDPTTGFNGATLTENANDGDKEEGGDPTTEFNGATLTEILNARSISHEIVKKCTEKNISSVARLRRLSYKKLKEYFKPNEGGFIDWQHVQGIWSGNVLPIDYIPPIRKQCEDYGIDLEYAQHFEELNVSNLKDVDEEKLQLVNDAVCRCSGTGNNKNGTCDNNGEEEGKTGDNEETAEGGFNKCIDTIRSAIEQERGKSGNNGIQETSDGDGTEEVQSAREKTIEAANTMRENVKGALDALNPQDLQQMNAEALRQKLDEMKGMVQSPFEVDEMGNNFAGPQGVLDKVSTDAIFEASAGYIPSYSDNKDLIAAASGGLALNGIGVFCEPGVPLVSSTFPLLASPDRVTTLGVFSSFRSKILKTTSESEASSFQSSACSLGMSMAESVQSEASASASVESRFASGSVSGGHARESNNSRSKQNDSTTSSFNNTKSQSAQITEYIMMPMQAFRIPRSAVKLSDEAIMDLRKVTDIPKAKAFFTKFGTHVSRARHTMGGVFFRRISMTCDKSLSTNKMFSAAGDQLEESKKSSTQVSVEAEGGTFVKASAAASAAHSRGHSSSMGSCEVASEEKGGATETCTYTFDTNCLGPNASTPEQFAQILQANNATWACIDRGDPTSLLPIWEIIETESRQIQKVFKDLSVNTDGKAEGPKNNAEIAQFLKDTWLGMLTPSKRELYKANPSIKFLLRESNSKREIFNDLSDAILEYAGIITYNDNDKYTALKLAVGESCAIMHNRKHDSDAIYPSMWIKSFLSLGRDNLTKESKKILDDMGDGINMMHNQDAAALAAQFHSHDWILFNAAFQRLAAEHMSHQQKVKNLIPPYWVPFKIFLSSKPGFYIGYGELEVLTNKTVYHLGEHDDKNGSFLAARKQFKGDTYPNGDFISLMARLLKGRYSPTDKVQNRFDLSVQHIISGTHMHLYQHIPGHYNQRFVPYKPRSTFADPNQFMLLLGRDYKTCLNFDNDVSGTVLRNTLLTKSTHNIFSIEPINFTHESMMKIKEEFAEEGPFD